MTAHDIASATIGSTTLLLVAAAISGWVANIVKLAGSSFDPLTGLVVLRAIGVVIAPLGAVLGFV